jgi:branched-subunit amino acid transport protein
VSDTLVLILTLVACGLATFAMRLSFIFGGKWMRLGPTFQSLLRYVPPAVLTALIAPELLIREGAIDVSTLNPRFWAGLLAIGAALVTRSVLLTIIVGMSALWLLRWLF